MLSCNPSCFLLLLMSSLLIAAVVLSNDAIFLCSLRCVYLPSCTLDGVLVIRFCGVQPSSVVRFFC